MFNKERADIQKLIMQRRLIFNDDNHCVYINQSGNSRVLTFRGMANAVWQHFDSDKKFEEKEFVIQSLILVITEEYQKVLSGKQSSVFAPNLGGTFSFIQDIREKLDTPTEASGIIGWFRKQLQRREEKE